MACVSAAGLLSICAAHGHGDHLLLLCKDSDTYRCPFRLFLRLVNEPSMNRNGTALEGLEVFNAGKDGYWVAEKSLLSFFGAQAREKPADLVQTLINNAKNSRIVRCLWNTDTRKLQPGASNLSAARVWVLSPAAASTAFRSLASSSVPDSPFREALQGAVARLFQQTQHGQQQHQQQTTPTLNRDQRLEMATLFFRLSAELLSALPIEQCLSKASRPPSLCSALRLHWRCVSVCQRSPAMR